eukprot:scaffold2807_cov60-Phaeocystis_antarctica.AAC.6
MQRTPRTRCPQRVEVASRVPRGGSAVSRRRFALHRPRPTRRCRRVRSDATYSTTSRPRRKGAAPAE